MKVVFVLLYLVTHCLKRTHAADIVRPNGMQRDFMSPRFNQYALYTYILFRSISRFPSSEWNVQQEQIHICYRCEAGLL
jgi:hypothetical protein